MKDLKTFIEEHIALIEPLETEGRIAWWNLATTGDIAYATELENNNLLLRAIYHNKTDDLYLQAQPPAEDQKIFRQQSILLNRYRQNRFSPDLTKQIVKLESEIENIYTTFRPKLEGLELSNNDIKDILTLSSDLKKRQAAWQASKAIGAEVEQKIFDLITLRNKCAQEAGFKNFYSMELELQDISETSFFEDLKSLEELTNPLWNDYKTKLDLNLSARFQLKTSDLMPWHYEDPFFQEAPRLETNLDSVYLGKDIVEISRRFFQNVGLPIEDILERSDLFERPQKNQHAFCLSIDHKQDVRILCNLRDNEYWMNTQLHELGHAVYEKNVDSSLPYLLREPAHISTNESVAMLFGRFSKEKEFLNHYCGLDSETSDALGLNAKKQAQAHLLVFTRWCLVMIHFEQAMYQNPEANLNDLWWEYVHRFQGLSAPEGRKAPDWASKLHLACAPVYYQNYLIGEMTASQLLHSLHKNNSKSCLCCSSKTGLFLKERLFKLGKLYKWNELVQRATGEKLNPRYFVNDMGQ